jgi:hypothetical protein
MKRCALLSIQSIQFGAAAYWLASLAQLAGATPAGDSPAIPGLPLLMRGVLVTLIIAAGQWAKNRIRTPTSR